MACSAAIAGYRRITAVDAFGDSDLHGCARTVSTGRDLGMPFCDQALRSACAGIPRRWFAYGGGMEHRPDLVAELAGGAGLLGNPPEVLRRVRDLRRLHRVCREEDIPVPATLHPPQDSCPRDGAWLRKRTASAAGAGVCGDDGGSLREGEVFQRHVPGRVISCAFLAAPEGVRLLGVTEQLVGREAFGASGFLWCGNVTPLPGKSEMVRWVAEHCRRYAGALTGRFGLVGLNGIDLVLPPAGPPVLLEVNPRFTGSMELFDVPDRPLFGLHSAACLEGELPDAGPWEEGGLFRGKAVVYARRPCRAPGTDEWRRRGRRDIPWKGDRFASGEPICTVLASAPDGAGCLNGLERQAEDVYREMLCLRDGAG